MKSYIEIKKELSDNSLTIKQLQKICQEMGISKRNTKEETKKTILNYIKRIEMYNNLNK